MPARKPTNERIDIINHNQRVMAASDQLDRLRRDIKHVEEVAADVREMLRTSAEQASAERRELTDKVERAVAAFERLTEERRKQLEFDEEIAGYLAGSRSAIQALQQKVDGLQAAIHQLQESHRRSQPESLLS